MLKSALTMFALFCLTPTVAGEPAGTARNGAVELAYWLQGPRDGLPLVIINGQGAATRSGDGFTAALAAAGFRVITFDNRDSGRSTVLGAAGAPPSMEDIMAGHAPAYDLSDMAADTVAVLDAVGVSRAHVVGHSLGGMVAQMLAASHPDRVLSLVSVSSTSGAPGLPLGPALAALSQGGADEAPAMQQAIAAYRIFEGEARLRMSDAEVAARVAADMAVGDPNAAARQFAAAMARGDRSALMRGITRPALVIHGGDDPWFPLVHAQSTAAALGNARIEIVEGMGHIISDEAAPAVAARIAAFVSP